MNCHFVNILFKSTDLVCVSATNCIFYIFLYFKHWKLLNISCARMFVIKQFYINQLPFNQLTGFLLLFFVVCFCCCFSISISFQERKFNAMPRSFLKKYIYVANMEINKAIKSQMLWFIFNLEHLKNAKFVLTWL
jgi:hypothetical protein